MFQEPKWRYFTSGECVDLPDPDSLVSANCPTKETLARFNEGQALFIEVGRVPEGEFVWRSIFDRGPEWTNTLNFEGFEEPDYLTTSIKEILGDFSAINEARDIVGAKLTNADLQDSEDDQEILKNLGRYVEERLEMPRHNGYYPDQCETANTVHITPEDYELLRKASDFIESSSRDKYHTYQTTYSRKGPSVGLKDESVSPAPSYFFQVKGKPTQPTSHGRSQGKEHESFHIVVKTDESPTGKITAETFLVMPSKASNIQAVPDWVAEMLSGEGDFAARWQEAIHRGIQGFERYHSQISSGQVFPDEQILLNRHHFFDSRMYKTRTLDHFLTSVLQNEVEEIMSTAPSGKPPTKGKHAAIKPRVSGMVGIDSHSLKDFEMRGLFRSCDLSGPPACVSTVLRVIQESQKRKEQEEAMDARRKELEQIQHEQRVELERQRLETPRESPPSYETLFSDSSVTRKGSESERADFSKKSGGSIGTAAEGTSALALMTEADHLEVQARPRRRSKSPWRHLLCGSHF